MRNIPGYTLENKLFKINFCGGLATFFNHGIYLKNLNVSNARDQNGETKIETQAFEIYSSGAPYILANIYFMLSGRISKYIGENIFRSYTGTTSENTDFHVLVA